MTRKRARAPNRISISVFGHPETVGRFGAAEHERDPGEAGRNNREPAGQPHHGETRRPVASPNGCHRLPRRALRSSRRTGRRAPVHQRHEKQAENVEAEGHRPGQRPDEKVMAMCSRRGDRDGAPKRTGGQERDLHQFARHRRSAVSKRLVIEQHTFTTLDDRDRGRVERDPIFLTSSLDQTRPARRRSSLTLHDFTLSDGSGRVREARPGLAPASRGTFKLQPDAAARAATTSSAVK